MNKLYKSETTYLYRQSFCAYFDILGFSQKINNEDLKYFEKYLKVLRDEINYLNDKHDFQNVEGYKSFELKIFTDNFVIGFPWKDIYGESELGYLHEVLSHVQFNFIKHGIFLKGAISLSKLFMDENIVLGQALIESYKLEDTKCIFPRIILSEKVKEVVNKHIGYYSDKKTSPQNKQYLLDKDGFLFVNYLFCLIYDSFEYKGYEDFEFIESELLLHKKSIEKELKEHAENYHILIKFIWCAEYHNFFCNTFLNEEKYNIKKLLIKETLFKKEMKNVH